MGIPKLALVGQFVVITEVDYFQYCFAGNGGFGDLKFEVFVVVFGFRPAKPHSFFFISSIISAVSV